jgi:Ca2+-binding RTX toxin-like protein
MISNDDLFQAILSMDSYNRGYLSGLVNLSGGGQIGNATIGTSSSVLGTGVDQAAGFYAQKYTLAGGQIVVAYRGTDVNFSNPIGPTGSDLLNGYGVGGGSPFGLQAQLAVQFYNLVADSSPTGSVALTGHSMGGGLAAYVATLYGEEGRLFDNMAFELAASNAKFYANAAYEGTAPLALQAQANALLQSIYGGEQPWATDRSFIQAWNTAGEFLTANRLLQQTVSTPLSVGPNVDLPGLDNGLLGSNLHSMSLLVMLMYADNAGIPTDWMKASKYFMPSLFNDAIASAVNVTAFKGVSAPNDVLRDAIAYSTISDGVRVFGDTGIRTLFDDANDLGKTLGLTDASSTVTKTAAALSNIFTQFAGQLAIGQVLQSNSASALSGVVTLTSDQKTLSVDFADALWSIGRGASGVQTNITGRSDLIDALSIDPTSSDIRSGMKLLWNAADATVFDRAVFATKNDALTTTLTDREVQSSKVTIFVAGGGNDIITGSADNDFIYGGEGTDDLKGAAGKDLLAGGKGDDTLRGGAGNDYLAGGDDTDTVIFDEKTDAQTGVQTGEVFELNNDPAQAVAGAAPSTAVKHGDQVDTLQSIEKLKLSAGADTLRLGAKSTLGDLKEVDAGDAGDGVDTMDFAGSPAGVTMTDLKVSGSDTVLKNFEVIVGSAFADTFKFSSVAAFTGLKRLDGAGQAKDTSDTLDFSQMAPGEDNAGVTIASHEFVATHTKLDNFEKIIGTSGNDNIEYSNGTSKIEVYGGGGIDNIKTGAGDDLLDGGDEGDTLQGGEGFDRYKVTHLDTVTDSDGRGSVATDSETLTGGLRVGKAGAFTSNSGDKYIWHGEGNGVGELTIITHLAERITITDFHNGDLGIVLKQINKPDPFPDTPFVDPPVSPLVLDLDGNGIGLSSTASGVHFDFGGDHFRELTGWVNPGEGLLVYDANHDGSISDGTELFGSSTTDGFQVLAYYDGRTGGNYYTDRTGGTVNAALVNGAIDASDPIFSQLQVWRDLNQDGIAQAGELTSLADEGIARINLANSGPDAETALDAEITGNQILQVGTFEKQDGSSAVIGDVWFTVDQAHTIYDGPSAPGLETWPDLRGYGNIDQLHNALSGNPALQSEFHAFIDKVETQSIANLIPQFEALMYEWAEVPADYQVDRGGYIDGRELALLERAYDRVYLQKAGWNEGTTSPGPQAGAMLHSVFENAVASYFVKFLAQIPEFTQSVGDVEGQTYVSRYAPLAAALHYNPADDSVDFDAAALASALQSTDLTDKTQVENALDIFGLLTIVETYELKTDVQFFGELRDAMLANGAAQLIPLIDSFRMTVPRYTSPYTSDDGTTDYTPIALNFDNAGQYTVVEANATVEQRPSSISFYTADLFYVQSGLGMITFEPERSPANSFYGPTIQDKIILSSEFDDAPYTVERDLETGDVRFVFATLDTTIVLKSYLDTQQNIFGNDWSTGSTSIAGQTIYFANGTVLQPTDIAELVVQGSEGNDVLKGIWVNHTIDGKGGDDIIDSGGYDLTIIGGTGDDQLSSKRDQAVFIFNVGDGNDTISQSHGSTLQLNGIAPADVFLTRGGANDADLLVTFLSHPDDSINLLDEFGSQAITKFTFGDGTVWSFDDIRTRLVLQNASDGDDIIIGFDGSDILAGGKGDDILQGAPSSFSAGDTYIYQRGDGNDTIIPSYIYSEDVLNLVGIRSDQTTVTRSGDDVVLTFSVPEGGSITIQDQFGPYGFHGLEKVVFSDGVVWSQRDFVANINPSIDTPTIVGTSGDDILDGTSGNDGIAGLGGDDILRGGAGSDTYFFGVGSGHDIIQENGSNDYHDVDVVKLGVTPSEVELTRGDTDIVIKIIATGETLTLQDYFFGNFTASQRSDTSVERLEFSDGTVWDVPEVVANAWIRGTDADETLTGTRDADVIYGGGGNDLLRGSDGDDTYIIAAGSGNSRIDELSNSVFGPDGGIDTVRFIDSTIDDLQFRKVMESTGLAFVVERKDGSASATFNLGYGLAVEKAQFSDGTVVSLQDLLNQAEYVGTNAGETVVGGLTDDRISGLGGDDQLFGDEGSDTYLWSRGDGNDTITDYFDPGSADTLHLSGITPSLVQLERIAQDNGFDAPFYNLAVHIQPLQTTDVFETITIAHEFDLNSGFAGTGIEFIEFDDGTIWNRAQFAASTPLVGTSSDDNISGSEFADVITGGLGDDVLHGGPGNDTYIWSVGDGNDQIEDGYPGDFDTLRLHGVNPAGVQLIPNSSHESPDVLVHINASGEEIRISDQLSGDGEGVDQIVFDNGVVWDSAYIAAHSIPPGGGTPGNDILTGDNFDNEFDGRGGNDTITGLGGDDFIDGGSGNDTAVYSGNRSDYLITYRFNDDTYTVEDLRPDADGTDTVTSIENFRFADGTVNVNNILFTTITGTEGDDVLHGDVSNNLIDGLGGNDVIFGGGGDDAIFGGAGNDVLWGDAGYNTFVAAVGDGDDVIHGGDDPYNALDFGAITTAVTVDLSSGTATGVDIGTDTFTRISDVFGGSGGDLIISGPGDDYLDGGAGFDTLSYQSATAGVNVDLGVSGQQDTVGAGQDFVQGFEALVGSAFADRLRGDGGDNNLTGLAGGDTFVFTGTFGNDVVTDFSVQDDSLQFWDTRFSDSAAVLAAATQVGADVVIDAGASGSVTLTGMSLADLASAQITIVAGPVDAPDIIKPQSTLNTSIENAIQVTPNYFDLIDDPDIDSSTTIPHATILATASGEGHEYYAVTVGAGDRVIFDIDQGFDTVIQIMDAGGNVIDTNDDDDVDPGSRTFNSLLDHTFNQAGTYYLAVGSYSGDEAGVAPDAGETYTLHISIDHATPVGNQAPVTTASDVTAARGESIDAGSLFSVSDANSDAITAYQFYDATATTSSGHWVVNGVAQGANATIDVTPDQLSQTSFLPNYGSDDLYVRANDGTTWGAWTEFHVTAPANQSAVTTATDVTASRGQLIDASSLFSVSDSENDTIAAYQFYDATATLSSGHWMVNGVAQGANATIDVTPEQLAQTSFLTNYGSDDLYVRANDGTTWGAWTLFHVTAPANQAAVTTASDVTATRGQSIDASSLFSVSDTENDAITGYQFYDATATASSGHWVVDGVAQGANATIDVTPEQLSQTAFLTNYGSDDLYVRANDGTSWGTWTLFHVTAPANQSAVATASDVTAERGESIDASSLFSVNDTENDAITAYQFYDATAAASSGHWVVNGIAQGANATIDVTPDQLSQTSFLTNYGSDDLYVRANDGTTWGAWTLFHVTAPANQAAVTTASDVTAARGESIDASSLFSVSDAENDAITAYQFYDATATASSGHWMVNGVAQGANATIDVTPEQLAQTSFLTNYGSDDLYVRANDGTSWGTWTEFHVTAPANQAPVITSNDLGLLPVTSSVPAAALFSVSDAEDDAITSYQFYDSNAASTSAHWALNGVEQDANQAITVLAANLNEATLVAGSMPDSDLYVRANDGTSWSDWHTLSAVAHA